MCAAAPGSAAADVDLPVLKTNRTRIASTTQLRHSSCSVLVRKSILTVSHELEQGYYYWRGNAVTLRKNHRATEQNERRAAEAVCNFAG
jgi:hypothetical protein